MKQKSKTIKSLVNDYCKKHLDKDYLTMCTKAYDDLIMEDENIFRRGKPEIWAASIIWAIGGLNFLGDKSFVPYATLSDVCSFFDANLSTVGQKTRKIKDLLDISIWNTEYRLPNSGVGNFFDNLIMTDDGFIITKDMLEGEKEVEEEDVIVEDNDPTYYKIVLKPGGKTSSAQIYQLEYTLKKMLEEDEKLIKFEIKNYRELIFTYYGYWELIEKIKAKINRSDFEITDVYYADNKEALE